MTDSIGVGHKIDSPDFASIVLVLKHNTLVAYQFQLTGDISRVPATEGGRTLPAHLYAAAGNTVQKYKVTDTETPRTV